MGLLDKAKGLLEEHKDQIQQGLDKAKQTVNKAGDSLNKAAHNRLPNTGTATPAAPSAVPDEAVVSDEDQAGATSPPEG